MREKSFMFSTLEYVNKKMLSLTLNVEIDTSDQFHVKLGVWTLNLVVLMVLVLFKVYSLVSKKNEKKEPGEIWIK